MSAAPAKTASTASFDYKSLIPYLTCPITKKVFQNPYVTNDGVVYEILPLHEYLQKHGDIGPNGIKITKYTPVQPLKSFIDTLQETHVISAEQRYEQRELPKFHIFYMGEIQNIMAKKKYKELLNYSKFDLSLLRNHITTIVQATKLNEEYTAYVKHLITASIDPNAQLDDNWTIFTYVWQYGSPQLVSSCIDMPGVDLKVKKSLGTPICIIAKRSTGANVIKMMEKGISIMDVDDWSGIAPFHSILQMQDLGTIKTIMNGKDFSMTLGVKLKCKMYLDANSSISQSDKESLYARFV